LFGWIGCGGVAARLAPRNRGKWFGRGLAEVCAAGLFLYGGENADLTMVLGVQCFLAREALGWTMSHLAHVAEVSPQSVARFERGGMVKASTLQAIQRTLEKAGVIFIDANDGGPGARLRKDS
jgi:Helix-turn-helix